MSGDASGMSAAERAAAKVESFRLIVGMEVHVELATRRKMFARVGSPAHPEFEDRAPNELVDPVVLALPGALPVMNRAAVEMSVLVGLALGCEIAPRATWDRKAYFYPDLPKAYQISQYDRPVCAGGAVECPGLDGRGVFDPDAPATRVGIVRAHLEEDAGKLLHESPGGGPIGGLLAGSIVDLNRAGTPLLEIVTEPDLTSAEQAVSFARTLRQICRYLGVSEGVMQKGHMRFEPNINGVITLADGRTATTPIVEIKNLNSFRALHGAIEHERRAQPDRWKRDGRVFGPGAKTTRGWDDHAGKTVVQREKEDAHDYRYFPDPDLPPVELGAETVAALRARVVELPLARMRRGVSSFGLSGAEAQALCEERELSDVFDGAVDHAAGLGVGRDAAGRLAANLLLQVGARLANERGVLVHELGVPERTLAEIVVLRDSGDVSATAAETLFEHYAERSAELRNPMEDPAALAARLGLVTVRDQAQLEAWCDAAIAENPDIAEQVRGGKVQAAGRLIGAIMKASGGSADAKAAREMLLSKLG